MTVEAEKVARVDGRLARSQRTRAAIAEALLALLDSGNVQPTVEEIALGAGVAPRTVFQHFPDREALFTEVGERQARRIAPLIERLPSGGSLDERLDALIDQRARVYEAIASVRRAALLMEPFSEGTRDALESFRDLKRRQVQRLFAPELALRPQDERALMCAALAATASWSAWDALRTQQGLDAAAAAAAMRRTLRALLTAT